MCLGPSSSCDRARMGDVHVEIVEIVAVWGCLGVGIEMNATGMLHDSLISTDVGKVHGMSSVNQKLVQVSNSQHGRKQNEVTMHSSLTYLFACHILTC